MVVAAAAVVVQPLQHLLHLGGEDHGGAQAVTGIQCVVQIR